MYENVHEHGEGVWYQPPERRARVPRWLLIAALALAFALALGIGAALGSTILQTAQASSLTPGGASHVLSLAATPGTQMHPSGPGAQGAAGVPGQQGQPGQCSALTVASVSGQTIVAKAVDGTTVTIHTSASTQYTKGGQTATASAVTAGTRIHVDGTHNSDGSITATRIDVG